MTLISGVLRNRFSFQQQLVLVFSFGIICLALVSSLVISTITNRSVYDQILQQGRKTSMAFAEQSVLALLYQSDDSAKDAARAILEFPDVIGVAIRAPDNTWSYSEGSAISRPISGAGDSSEVQRINGSHYWETPHAWYFQSPVYAGGESVQVETSPFAGNAEQKREFVGYVYVAVSKETLTALSNDIIKSNLMISIGLSTFLLLLLVAVTKRLIKPLRSLTATMLQAEHGNIEVRAKLDGSRDIVHMENAFNTMMNELEAKQQELQRARDCALGAAHAKGEFAATVSHELRTPMNGVLGMLELLMQSELNLRQSECTKVAYESGNALLTLIDDLLDFSKIESGKMRISMDDYSPREVLDDISELLSVQFNQKGLYLDVNVDKNIPFILRGDSGRIRQVIINMVGNALKFTEQGGVDISLLLEDCFLKVSIKDTGVGIAEDAHKRIFEAFSQADGSTTRKYGGTGLGLSISRQLVDLMGGSMGVESQLGEGSTFWFTLPMDKGDVARSVEPADLISLAGLRVLLVTSDPLCQEQLSLCLSTFQCFQRKTKRGYSALDMLKQEVAQGKAYDLLVVDSSMDDMSSTALLHLITENPAINNTKLIFLCNENDSSETYGDEQEHLASIAESPGIALLRGIVTQDVLYQTIHALMTNCAKQQESMPPKLPTARKNDIGTETSDFNKPHVLVVEDNHANQLVALGMLERLGCRVRIANNGKEAVDGLSEHMFDLVLMDCHMPVLDGYTATETIRRHEDGKHRTTIIAMTAHAGRDDKDRCIAAGMDDYIAKPISFAKLQAKLSHWLGFDFGESATLIPALGEGLPLAPTDVVKSPKDLIDYETFDTLRIRLGEYFPRVIETFLENTPGYLDKLKYAFECCDMTEVRSFLHCVKGSLLNIGAVPLANQCGELEKLCEDCLEPGADELLESILLAYQDLHEILNELPKQQHGQSEEQCNTLAQVLIVDDDPATLLVLHGVLERDGYLITEAHNGERAVHECRKNMPDLILMDAMMPGMDGFTACKEILQLDSEAYPTILIVTALHDEESIEKAFIAGATDFIPKPVNFMVLRKRVERLLQSRRSEQHVHQLAYYDNLTNLPNRTQFMERASELLARANMTSGHLALFFLDIDRFKFVNDTQGHDVGDLLLKTVAQRLQGCLRAVDIVARLGGDEFIIVLDDIKALEGAAVLAEKINKALTQPFSFVAHEIRVSVSIGIALYPSNGSNIGTLMKRADTAMFRAKAKGGASFQFYEYGMETEITRRIELESELRRAIGNDELVLHYQPQASLQNGEICGLEALVRWQHPQRGFLPPGEFLSVAEESGLIVGLGSWVISRACRQQREWLDRGMPEIPIAVNVATIQWESGDLYEEVQVILKEYNIPAHLLKLELTEETLADTSDEMIEQMQNLKALGVTLEIDDFGTGYSSLCYLKRFPVEVLKIDQSFIKGLPEDKDDAAIVTGVIALGHSLNLKIIAEGVETDEQKAFLAKRECDTMQGYFLCRPLEPAAIELWLSDYVCPHYSAKN